MAKSTKPITLDELARMMQKEFSDIHQEFKQVHEMDKLFVDEFDRIRSDIQDIKTTLGPLVRLIAQQEREMSDITIRLNRVERKVGIRGDWKSKVDFFLASDSINITHFCARFYL